MRVPAGSSRSRRSRTGCSPATSLSTGCPIPSSTGAWGTSSKTSSTGGFRGSVTGARRCRSGSATSAEKCTSSAVSRNSKTFAISKGISNCTAHISTPAPGSANAAERSCAKRKLSTAGSIRAACRLRSCIIRLRTRIFSKSIFPPISFPKPSIRRAAGFIR